MPRALVVDDNDAMRYATARLLRRAGFDVTEAATGSQALAAAQAKPDFVLLDLNLPDISGFEVCRRLRSDPDTSSILVIQISASLLDQESRDRSQGSGADGFIAQPVSNEELLATINGYLSAREQTRTENVGGAHAHRETDLRSVLAALREKNETLSAVVNASPLAIVAFDIDAHVTLWNDAAERIFGWSQDEALGCPAPFIPEGQEEEYGRLHREALRKRQVMAYEAQTLTKDGRRVEVQISTAPLIAPDDTPRGRVAVLEDVSFRKRSEALLRRNEKLIATGRMAASLAHEINNPLSSLVNLIYLLDQEEHLSPRMKTYIELAREEVNRVAGIVRHMLAVHRESPTPVRIEVAKVLDSALELYAAVAREQQVIFDRQYDTAAAVEALPGEMRQAFSNLIGNALHAMPRGGRLVLRVRRSRDWAGKQRPGVRVTIADSGTGIPLEHRRDIFEPFYTTKGEKGTGLGLWVVQQAIERARGRLHLRTSTDGRRGTCFSLFFPDRQSIAAPHGNSEVA